MADFEPKNLPAWLNFAGLPARILRSKALRGLADRMVSEGGVSSHSARGETVAYFVARLTAAGVPYSLQAHPGRFYAIKVEDPRPGISDHADPLVALRERITDEDFQGLMNAMDDPAVMEPDWDGSDGDPIDWHNQVGEITRRLWLSMPPEARAGVYLDCYARCRDMDFRSEQELGWDV